MQVFKTECEIYCFTQYISMKSDIFDIFSYVRRERSVVIKHFTMQIQAVMLTNPSFHAVLLVPGKNTHVLLLLLIFASPLILIASFMKYVYGMVNYASSCLLFLQADFLSTRPAWYKTFIRCKSSLFSIANSNLIFCITFAENV